MSPTSLPQTLIAPRPGICSSPTVVVERCGSTLPGRDKDETRNPTREVLHEICVFTYLPLKRENV